MSSSAVDPGLAAAVLAEAARHKIRTAGRRTAGHLWVCLMTTSSVGEARRAIATFGDPAIQAAALELLDCLAAALTATTTEE